MILYLIRHGYTVHDKKGLLQRVNTPLAQEAKQQLKKLKKVLNNIRFSQIYSSSLPRAKQTARVIVENQKNIKELDFIYEYKRPQCLDGLTKEEGRIFWEEKHKEDKYDPQWKYDNGESFDDIVSRAEQLVELLYRQHDKEIVAIFGHGVFFRHLLGVLLAKEKYTPTLFFDFLRKIELNNGGYIMVEVNVNKKIAKIRGIYNES